MGRAVTDETNKDGWGLWSPNRDPVQVTVGGGLTLTQIHRTGNLSELCSVRFNLRQTRQTVDPG